MYWSDCGQLMGDAILATGDSDKLIHPLAKWAWKDAQASGIQTAEVFNLMRRDMHDFLFVFAESWYEQDADVVFWPSCVHDATFYLAYTSIYNLVYYPSVLASNPIISEGRE